ncbi:MAG: LemA family protein [Bacteroidales bacterium]|jgi:LemA protein|nr:LemA family protein [Bacteroidales bacterium]MBR6333428.1 LemA family protein [Bacteroidales bacterium]
MKKTLLVLLVLALILIGAAIRPYNQMVSKEETCNQAWSNVESVYQRRMDLIPNLVATVQGAADFEKSTLEAVINARAKATAVNVSADNLSEESIAKFQAVQDELSSAISRLLVSVERYPELTATQGFRELQAQLEGIENRIAVERNKYNETVQIFNSYIRRFPNNIVAGICGFKSKGYFKATPGAENSPSVEFNFK